MNTRAFSLRDRLEALSYRIVPGLDQSHVDNRANGRYAAD